MLTLRSLEGMTVYGRNGGVVGHVAHVLFHPSEPIVVGLEVQPPNVGYVVSRSPRYIALPGISIGDDGLDTTDDVKEWSGARAEKALGFTWEKTVIWLGMPLITTAGKPVGFISDASFSLPDARLDEILIGEGITSDVAVGTRQVDGALAVSFDGHAVRVRDEVADAEFTGGVAAKAGTNVGVAKVVLGEASKTAAALGGRALKTVAGTKAAKGAWKMLKDTGKAFREGQKGDD